MTTPQPEHDPTYPPSVHHRPVESRDNGIALYMVEGEHNMVTVVVEDDRTPSATITHNEYGSKLIHAVAYHRLPLATLKHMVKYMEHKRAEYDDAPPDAGMDG